MHERPSSCGDRQFWDSYSRCRNSIGDGAQMITGTDGRPAMSCLSPGDGTDGRQRSKRLPLQGAANRSWCWRHAGVGRALARGREFPLLMSANRRQIIHDHGEPHTAVHPILSAVATTPHPTLLQRG